MTDKSLEGKIEKIVYVSNPINRPDLEQVIKKLVEDDRKIMIGHYQKLSDITTKLTKQVEKQIKEISSLNQQVEEISSLKEQLVEKEKEIEAGKEVLGCVRRVLIRTEDELKVARG